METLLKLIEQYKSITLAQLEEAFITNQGICGSSIMSKLTGFGSHEHCIICQSALQRKKEAHDITIDVYDNACDYCIYKQFPVGTNRDSLHCLDNTFRAISLSHTADELYQALQARINKLENLINGNIRERRMEIKS